MKTQVLLSILLAAAVLAAILLPTGCAVRAPKQVAMGTHVPNPAWSKSTPEKQGMDSRKLLEMIEYYREKQKDAAENGEPIAIDSITIIRNGYLAAEIYPDPYFPADTKHIIHSCTKSIMSALIGIAVARGDIKSIDTPVLDFFPDKKFKNVDARKKAMTVRHLLTMQTGLDSRDSYLFKWKGLFRMMKTDDWVAHALSLPMVAAPGTRFDYSNISSFLLSAVLTKAVGMDSLTYAKKHLFAPLGIKDVRWEKSPRGIYIGWARIWLKPRDMARIGLLYLRKGRWGDKQIIPAKWIADSSRAWADPGKYRYYKNEDGSTNYALSTGYWVFVNLFRPFSEAYGYQFWLGKDGVYTALGHQGQFIMMAPRWNLTAVFTGRLQGQSTMLPAKLLRDFILPAVISNRPIAPASPEVRRKLEQLAVSPPIPVKTEPVAPLSLMAKQISGKRFRMEANPWKFQEFRLTFRGRTATLWFQKDGRRREIQLGLDNVHRRTQAGPDVYLARGRWEDANTFVMESRIIGYSSVEHRRMRFQGKGLTLEEAHVTGKSKYKGKMVD